MRSFLSFLFILSVLTVNAQTYQSHFQEASSAYKAGDYSQMLVEIKNSHKLRPHHQTLIYYLAIAHSLNSNIDSANYWLREVLSIDAKNYDIDIDDFENLKSTQAYKDLSAYQAELLKPIINSDTAIVIPDEELHIEDVAYNPFENRYLLSSINKRNIYSFKIGELKPLFENPFPLAITGMAIQDTILWFTGAGFSQAGLDENDPNLETSKLYKADLKTDIVLDSFSVEDSETNVFGDVILSESGKVLVSDSKTNTVYRLENGKLKEWISSDEILSLQGVDLIGKKVFLADYSQGLFVFDTVQQSMKKIQKSPDLALKGIDGLYAYKNGLIVIQNGVIPHRIVYLKFDEEYNKVKSFKYLEKNHPAMGEPTLGYLQNDSLVYIATSFWELNENGKIKNEKGIKPVILILPLAETYKSYNSVSVFDYVKILDGKNQEVYHFYENNWAEFRRYALANGFISGFRMMKSESDEYDIILETQYTDTIQLNNIEKHYKNWFERNPGTNLLNELKPNDFRKNVKNETVYNNANFSKPSSQNKNCNSENHRAFDFWLGNWEVYNKNGDHIGTNNIYLIQNGCGIQENWTSKMGGAGTSYNFYDVKTEKWHQSWISSSGNALMMSGGFSNGKMQMQSEPLNGKIDKISWVPQEDESVLQIWEISTDDGETWKEAFWGKYVRNDF
ncbi:hypothetical protein ABWH96_08625 [Marivirga tractuosa]|uniref:hypothetical protein n=1 Tax=Marivirga tractuosa TaxID=1006 RepID=UPI0035CF2CB6